MGQSSIINTGYGYGLGQIDQEARLEPNLGTLGTALLSARIDSHTYESKDNLQRHGQEIRFS